MGTCIHNNGPLCSECLADYVVAMLPEIAASIASGDKLRASRIEQTMHQVVLQAIDRGVDEPVELAQLATLHVNFPSIHSRALVEIATGDRPDAAAFAAVSQFAVASGVALESRPTIRIDRMAS